MEPRAQTWLPFGLLVAGLIATVFVPRGVDGDDLLRLEALSRLLQNGEHLPTGYSLVGPIFSSPLWFLGQHLGPSPARWCAFYNLLLFVLALAVLNRLLRGVVPDDVRRSFFLLLLFGSMFPHHLQHYGAEPFTALLAAMGIVLLTVHGSAWGWLCLVLAMANTPAVFGGLVLVTGWQLVQTRRLRVILVPITAVGLFLLESWLRRGSLLASGYENNAGQTTFMPYSGRPGFSYPFYFGLLSILLSTGKGLVFFAPGLLLPLRRAEVSVPARSAWILWLLFLVGLVLVYARWWAWYGGCTWGPRFFLFASIPAAFTLAVALHEAPRRGIGWNLLALAILALSFWVGYDGLAIGQQNLEIGLADGYALEHLTWHVPEFSVLWRPFVVAPMVPSRVKLMGLLFLACFVHLAYPLLGTLGRQLRGVVEDWWAAQQERGSWRL